MSMTSQYYAEMLERTKERRQHYIDKVEFLEARLYLGHLWEQTTYVSQFLLDDDGKPEVQKLFILDPEYFIDKEELLRHIKLKVKQFKDIDDSNELPEWRHEAYRCAKVMLDHYELFNGKY